MKKATKTETTVKAIRRKVRKKAAGKPTRKAAADRIERQIDDLMWDVATIADRMLDLLPGFKRLSLKDRKRIFDHMDVCVGGLDEAVDQYGATLPKADHDDEDCHTCDLLDAAMALGMVQYFGKILERAAEDRKAKNPFPDSIDIPPAPDFPPKQITPGGEHGG